MSMEFPIIDDKGVLSVIAVMEQMWKNRTNTVKVVKLCALLSESCDESITCAELEMYLPQLCHFTVTMGAKSSQGKSSAAGPNETIEAAFEKVLMSMAQVSMHAAFRIRFMIGASLEDYQPENPDGTNNANKDDYLFYRCARILQNLDRCVAYGTPLLVTQMEKDIVKEHGIDVMIESTSGERKKRLKKIYDSNKCTTLTTGAEEGAPMSRLENIDTPEKMREGCHGWLLYKRAQRKAIYSQHSWKFRYFRIEQGVLFCSRGDDWTTARGGIMRAMALSGCTLICGADAIDKGDTTHKNYLLVKNFSTGFEFHLRADTDDNFNMWRAALLKEMQIDASFPYPLPSLDDGSKEPSGTFKRRQKRWLAFSQQNKFITDITDICERLRFIDRPLRPAFLNRDLQRLKIPPFAYIPLVNSNDTFSYILRAIPKKAYAFRTKARCPVLMYFETEQHPKERDIATFLSCELHEYPVNDILLDMKDIVLTDAADEDLAIADGESNESEIEGVGAVEQAPSRINLELGPRVPWRDSGAGLKRVGGVELLPEVVLTPKLADEEPPSVRRKDRRASSSHCPPEEELHLRASSPYSHLGGWGLEGFIAKSNDDLRQEMFVMQMITFLRGVFEAESDKLWLKSYQVMNTSQRTGLIQLIKKSSSLDAWKKREDFPGTLRALFVKRFGQKTDNDPDMKPGQESEPLKAAILNFVYSMAASSIVCYLLAIKDRHNGNVMLDEDGHIIHIDFGFVFGLAPGKAFSMETCPFKLTEEMVDVMGGPHSPHFSLYKKLCADAYVIASAHASTLCNLVDMMSHNSTFPCFQHNRNAAAQFKSRLIKMQGKKRFDIDQYIDGLVSASHGHSGTMFYDDFQVLTNGIKK